MRITIDLNNLAPTTLTALLEAVEHITITKTNNDMMDSSELWLLGERISKAITNREGGQLEAEATP